MKTPRNTATKSILKPVIIALICTAAGAIAQPIHNPLLIETERQIREYANPSPQAPIYLPGLTIREDAYSKPVRPYPESPQAPQYLINPYTRQLEQIK